MGVGYIYKFSFFGTELVGRPSVSCSGIDVPFHSHSRKNDIYKKKNGNKISVDVLPFACFLYVPWDVKYNEGLDRRFLTANNGPFFFLEREREREGAGREIEIFSRLHQSLMCIYSTKKRITSFCMHMPFYVCICIYTREGELFTKYIYSIRLRVLSPPPTPFNVSFSP